MKNSRNLILDTGGWEPKIQLQERLEKTVPYFDALLRQGIEVHTSVPACRDPY